MEIVVGSICLKENKILMIKESKKKCYGKWSFPAGRIEKNETIFEGAKRETLEETGCKVELKKAFPIMVKNDEDLNVMLLYFLADTIVENLKYNTDEILDIKWMDIEILKGMKDEEFRNPIVTKKIIECIEKGEMYNLEIIQNMLNL